MHASTEYTPADCRALRDALLGVVYNETAMKLLILQRSERMNRRLPMAQQQRKSTQRKSSHVNDDGYQVAKNEVPNVLALLSASSNGGADVEELLDENILNSLKFDRDLNALHAVFVAAYDDLEDNTTSSSTTTSIATTRLCQAVHTLSDRNDEEARVRAVLQKSKDELCTLQADIVHNKTYGDAQLRQYDERIADARHSLKCVSRVNELEVNLVVRWEASRLAQAVIWGENAERYYLRQILDYKRRKAGEERIIREVQSYRAREINELRDMLAAWQQKYARELQRIECELQSEEQCIANVHKALAQYHEINEQRIAYVQAYEAEKAEEQRQLELQLHRVECAVRIQAWWRGTMVRRGLGPYKKKPKRGKKSKAKGK